MNSFLKWLHFLYYPQIKEKEMSNNLEIKLKRWCGPDYTIGKLTIEDHTFTCDTLEDVNRDINKNGIFDQNEKKIISETAIPFGRYKITIDIVSPKFVQYPYYKDFCEGKLPRLLGVAHFSGILIHVGSYKDHTDGCILVGKNTIKGRLTKSKEMFEELYSIMQEARKEGKKIYITIE